LGAHAGSRREAQKSRQNKEFSHTGNRSRWSDGRSAVLSTCFVGIFLLETSGVQYEQEDPGEEHHQRDHRGDFPQLPAV
jgi:hypothetical protein